MQREIYSDYLRLLLGRKLGELKVVLLSGLPGCGKSTLAEILQKQYGYKYVSTDIARTDLLKLTKGKYATTEQYLALKEKVYEHVRILAKNFLQQKDMVVIDATHLNEQLNLTLEFLKRQSCKTDEVLVVYVDGGEKDKVKARFIQRPGKNKDGRSWVEAWETTYDFFVNQIKEGKVKVPENKMLGYEVVWVKNC